MNSYVARRLLLAIPTLLGVMVVVFLLTNVIGDPVTLLLPPDASAQQMEDLRRAMGLDQPLLYQFGVFVGATLRGDFGASFWQGRPAMNIVVERLPATLQLAAASVLLAVLVGFPLGAMAALKRNTAVDLAISTGALFGLSMPNFWLGLMLMLLFGVHLRWLPISGHGGLAYLVLPTVTLATSMMGILARLMRTELLDVLGQEYITTAYSKGLSGSVVIVKHAVRNALISSVTMVGLQFGTLLGGAVVVESVFAWPGIGRLIVRAIEQRDYPVIQVAVLLFACFFVLVNLAVDLTYLLLDPRIKYD